ncbi:MAG: preQ(1) synthase [Deltaproteobacteria bacterium]|nr:preQ(1) synthase [Deltaproteobacteria bacterium]
MLPDHEYVVKYRTDSPDIVDAAQLHPIDYHYAGKRDVEIVIRHQEFTSVCPMTGLPDFGRITVKYSPGRKIIELKSLKYYLMQYRNVGIYYEHVVNRILEDLVGALKPKSMEVIGDFTSRGGIDTTVTATFGD